MVPRSVGPWEIVSVIGRGGVGVVYRARHRTTRQLAALKLLGPAPVVDPRAARRLAREYEVLQRLDHPNVVRVFEAGAWEGYSYLAMELVEGLDLRAFLSPVARRASALALSPCRRRRRSSRSPAPATDADLGAEAIRTLAALMEEPATAPPEYPPDADAARTPARRPRRAAPSAPERPGRAQPAAADGAAPRRARARSCWRSTTSTAAAWSTGTSSRPTSWWTTGARRGSWTSAW